MAKQLVSKNTLLLAIGAIPTATNVVTTANNVLVNPKVAVIEYKDIGNGQAGNAKSISNDDDTTADFSVDVTMRSSGGLGVAPKYANLLKCCGLEETITALTDVAYKPMLVEQPATAKAYMDGYVRTITGIVGDFNISGKVGELAQLSFSLKGFTDATPTAEANPAVTLDSNSQVVVKSAVVSIAGGGTIELEEFTFSLNNQVEKIYAIGRKEFYIQDFSPTLKVRAVKTLGNDAHWADLQANTQKSITITLGTVAGDIIELTAPYCQPKEVSETDSSGAIVYENTWSCQSSAGGDNFTLTFK